MSNQYADKVLSFHEDRRLTVISAVRSLCLIGLLLTVIYCIFAYHESLNTVNARRIVSYIERMTLQGEETDTLALEWGLDNTYAPFDVGVASCSGGYYRFIPPFKDMEYSYQVKYGSPYIETCRDFLYVYDLGGRGVTRLNSYACLGDTTLESDIISLSANLSGETAVVTDEEGYRSAVVVMDKSFKQLFKWQTADHFIFMAALSPNGEDLAILCLGQRDGKADYYVMLQSIEEDDRRATIDLGDMAVYSIKYYSNGRLMILGETGLYAYNGSGELKYSYTFSEGTLMSFSHEREGRCAISLKGDVGDTSKLIVLDEDCEPVYEEVTGGSVRYMALRDNALAYLSPEGAVRINLHSGQREVQDAPGARDILITETGAVAAVYTDSAKILPFGKTGE